MDRNQFDTKDNRDKFVKQIIDVHKFDRLAFKDHVKLLFPSKDKADRDLVAKLMNSYYQVTTRDKLDTKEGRDEFVLESLRNKNYGREKFNEFVTGDTQTQTRAIWSRSSWMPTTKSRWNLSSTRRKPAMPISVDSATKFSEKKSSRGSHGSTGISTAVIYCGTRRRW